MLNLSLTSTGLLDPRRLVEWQAEGRKAVREAVLTGMRSGAKPVREAAREQMRRSFDVRRKRFVNSMTTKIYSAKQDRLPALWVGSKIPWLGIHQTGGTIRGNMLIPLSNTRLGPKRFKTIIEDLRRGGGNAFFVRNAKGQTILMAENIAEHSRQLTPFRRAERERTGAKRIKRGQEIPIAVLVKSVTMRRRFSLVAGVRRGLPALARAITQQLERI